MHQSWTQFTSLATGPAPCLSHTELVQLPTLAIRPSPTCASSPGQLLEHVLSSVLLMPHFSLALDSPKRLFWPASFPQAAFVCTTSPVLLSLPGFPQAWQVRVVPPLVQSSLLGGLGPVFLIYCCLLSASLVPARGRHLINICSTNK